MKDRFATDSSRSSTTSTTEKGAQNTSEKKGAEEG
jgi:hypothetical protein